MSFTISTRDVCLYVNNSQYDIQFGKPHMISLHSGKQMEIDGFNEQSLDTMYMNLNLYYGDMAADKGHIIKVVDYAWAAASVDEVKEVVVLTRSHRFEFTDSLLEDITAKMAEKASSLKKILGSRTIFSVKKLNFCGEMNMRSVPKGIFWTDLIYFAPTDLFSEDKINTFMSLCEKSKKIISNQPNTMFVKLKDL